MAGELIDNPVRVVNITLLDPDRRRMLIGVRAQHEHEPRHLLTVSAITKAVGPELFKLLTGGKATLDKPGKYAPQTPTEPVRLGHGEHAESTDAFVLEAVLGKIGITGALTAGTIKAQAILRLRTLSEVPDKDTGQTEWTDMLHWEAVLDPASDLSAIPEQSPSYNPIVWVDAAKVPTAYANHNVQMLDSPALDENLLICVTGACMLGAAHILSPQAEDEVMPLPAA